MNLGSLIILKGMIIVINDKKINLKEESMDVMKSIFNFESASLSESAFTSWWFSEDVFTVIASDNWLSMTEDNCSLVASSAFDVHEIGVWSWHQSF